MNVQNDALYQYFSKKVALNFDKARLDVLNDSEMAASIASAAIEQRMFLILMIQTV